MEYQKLEDMLNMIEGPNGSICRQIFADNRVLFEAAPGSTHNHQAWRGGYWDHVAEVMNLWLLLHRALESTARLARLIPEEQFSCSDGLLVLFLHDIEKLWRCKLVDGCPVIGADGRLEVLPEYESKSARKALAEAKISEYGLVLSRNHHNALRYVEGIRDADYMSGARIMLPLAALCHCCDLLSARAFYNFPFEQDDPWAPARNY